MFGFLARREDRSFGVAHQVGWALIGENTKSCLPGRVCSVRFIPRPNGSGGVSGGVVGRMIG